MKVVYVDLSAKLEQWARDSAVAASNGWSKAYYVPSSVKQRARQVLVERHGRKTVRYRLLAILIFVLLKEEWGKVDQVIIDRDYEGAYAESAIKNVLLRLIRSHVPYAPPDMVQFANVKGSKADEFARQVLAGKVRAAKHVAFDDLLPYLEQ